MLKGAEREATIGRCKFLGELSEILQRFPKVHARDVVHDIEHCNTCASSVLDLFIISGTD